MGLFVKGKLIYKAGEGSGGGGGGIDESRTIVKSDTIPTADEESLGKVYMYTGETNATYTHGYIYECMPTYIDSAVAFSSANITWSLSDFVAWLENAGVAYNRITHGTMTYAADGDLWTVLGIDDKGMPVFTWSEYTQDLIDAGCTFTVTPVDGDSSTFTFTTTVDGYVWVRRDVQPVNGSAIGSVSSVNGKTGVVVLDANNVGALPDTATASDIGALPDTTTASDIGALPDTTTAADIDGVPELSTMPTAASTNEGLIVMYSGTTDSIYTNGYFYKCTEVVTPSSVSASQTTGTSLSDIAVDKDTFETQIMTSGNYVFTSDGTVWSYDGNTVDLLDYGITYTGTPVVDDAITVAYTAESTSYAWIQTDVQPHQVISVNGKTGVVVLTASDVGALPDWIQATDIGGEAATSVVSAASNPLPIITGLSTSTIYNFGEMGSIEIRFPLTDTVLFISQMYFTSGTTPTAFTSPDSMKWFGDDVVAVEQSGVTRYVFVPVASKRYAIMFFYDGTAYRGIVQAA